MENNEQQNITVDNTVVDINNQNENLQQDILDIPKEYREKSWTKNIKSIYDLYKSYDNAQSLIGKKTIGIPDFEKSTEEDIKDFYNKITPQDIKDYDFKNMSDKDKNFFGELFKNNGVNKIAGQNIIKAYNEYQEQFLSEDGFNSEMKERFGNEYKNKVNDATSFFRKYISEKDSQILDKLPNQVLGAMLTFADNVKMAYGIEIKSSADNKQSDNTCYTKADYEKTVLEMFNLDKQGQLTEEQKRDYTTKLQNMSTKIKW